MFHLGAYTLLSVLNVSAMPPHDCDGFVCIDTLTQVGPAYCLRDPSRDLQVIRETKKDAKPWAILEGDTVRIKVDQKQTPRCPNVKDLLQNGDELSIKEGGNGHFLFNILRNGQLVFATPIVMTEINQQFLKGQARNPGDGSDYDYFVLLQDKKLSKPNKMPKFYRVEVFPSESSRSYLKNSNYQSCYFDRPDFAAVIPVPPPSPPLELSNFSLKPDPGICGSGWNTKWQLREVVSGGGGEH